MGLTPATRERFRAAAGRVPCAATKGDADVNQFAASFVRGSFNLTGDQDGRPSAGSVEELRTVSSSKRREPSSVGVSLPATAVVGALESLDISVSSDFGRGAPGFGQGRDARSGLLAFVQLLRLHAAGFDDVMSIVGVTDRRVIMDIFVAVWLNLNAPADDYRPVLKFFQALDQYRRRRGAARTCVEVNLRERERWIDQGIVQVDLSAGARELLAWLRAARVYRDFERFFLPLLRDADAMAWMKAYASKVASAAAEDASSGGARAAAGQPRTRDLSRRPRARGPSDPKGGRRPAAIDSFRRMADTLSVEGDAARLDELADAGLDYLAGSWRREHELRLLALPLAAPAAGTPELRA